MDGSAYWTAVGAIAVAVIGVIGNRWLKAREERQSDRDFTTSITATREAQTWALMESRIEDLEEALGRLSNSNDKLRAENDRLREERDKARLDATDWQIEAHKASGAIARVTELQQQCEQERLQHAEEVRGLREQIAKLRKRGNE